jgi:hypothetical protein
MYISRRMLSKETISKYLMYPIDKICEMISHTTYDIGRKPYIFLQTKHKKIYSADLVEALFAYPITTPVNLGKKLDVHYKTASSYLSELVKGKVCRKGTLGNITCSSTSPS